MTSTSITVVGGCGHVGLPLGVALAESAGRVTLLDIAAPVVERVNAGEAPFLEPGMDEALKAVRAAGTLEATTDPTCVSMADVVVIVIGTPVDEHLNPDPNAVVAAIDEIASHMRDGQLVVLRSTVYPGVTAMVERHLAGRGLNVDVAFCPERIAEGKAMEELRSLPQIIGASTETARVRARALFGTLTQTLLDTTPEEAELAKLFTNTWRYIKFATANQFLMIANDHGLDFDVIRDALMHDYPRAADMPRAGFAAGPCLFKDTMQLAAFNDNGFQIGHAAMLVNEGLPLYVVSQIERDVNLSELTVGILGMAFKAESDDIRSSLSYKLKRILRFKAKQVLCTDPYVTAATDASLVPLEEVLARADILVIGAPHPEYRDLQTALPVKDVWGITGRGVRL
ncbi:MAG: nucleotide sugar dehydrogenase [Thermoleophilia bacterium]|nr:nucleotide sugar dehydrogenase [Thermoleophilia bacterium]